MKIYEVLPEFLDDTILKLKKFQRVEINNQRYYLDPETNKIKSSVTTVIHNTMPTSPFLLKWYADLGMEKAKQIMQDKADYGTIMHIFYTKWLLTKEINFSEDLVQACFSANIDVNKIDVLTLKKDCLSFIKFCQEKNVKPIAVEYPVMNNNFAGTIDLICELDFNRSRVVAIIDYKSGKNGFYDSYKVQLHAYKQLLADNDFNVDMVFNFAPKDWQFKSGASYSLENQSDEKWSKMWNLYSELYLLQQDKKEVVNYNIADVINETNLENCITNEIFEVA